MHSPQYNKIKQVVSYLFVSFPSLRSALPEVLSVHHRDCSVEKFVEAIERRVEDGWEPGGPREARAVLHFSSDRAAPAAALAEC